MRTVAIYARVSTEHEAQISALGNQIQYYDELLIKHPDWVLYERYIDEGITGTSIKKRKNFLRMMKDAEERKFDLIITREVSRFARNTVDTLQQTRTLKKMGVEVYFTEDNIWTMNDEDGELRLTIMATLAQNESKKISARVKAGQMISFHNGVAYGNGNILGYDRCGKDFIVNEEQAKTVRRIFELYLEGYGVKRMKFILEQEGHLTATGLKKWEPGNLSRILRNPFYCGVVVYRKQFVPDYLEQKKINNFGAVEKITVQGKHEPIITKEEFEKVQRILDSRSMLVHNKGKTGKSVHADMWGRKLTCQCSSSFQRITWKRSPTCVQYAYQCYKQVKTGTVKTRERKGLSTEGICTSRIVPRWKLEAMAAAVFQKFWNDKRETLKLCNEMIDTCYRDDIEDDNKRIKESLEAQITKLERNYSNLVDMRMNGEIERERYDEKRTQILKEKEEVLTKLDAFQRRSHITEETFEHKIEVLKQAIEQKLNFDVQSIPEEVLDDFIKEIVVYDDYFVWILNFSSDRIMTSIDGKLNGYKVTQTQFSSAGSEPYRQHLHRIRLAFVLIRRIIHMI